MRKDCSRCGEEKDVSEFSRNGYRFRPQCLSCRRKSDRDWYARRRRAGYRPDPRRSPSATPRDGFLAFSCPGCEASLTVEVYEGRRLLARAYRCQKCRECWAVVLSGGVLYRTWIDLPRWQRPNAEDALLAVALARDVLRRLEADAVRGGDTATRRELARASTLLCSTPRFVPESIESESSEGAAAGNAVEHA